MAYGSKGSIYNNQKYQVAGLVIIFDPYTWNRVGRVWEDGKVGPRVRL